MRIRFALLRKEADLCRSKGLYEEARDLYAGFVAHSAEIDSDTKAVIEEQLHLIESEMSGGHTGAPPQPSHDRVVPIQEGSGASAHPSSDLRACTRDDPPSPESGPKDEIVVKDPDWLDGLAEIYSLVARDAERSSSQELKAELPPGDTEKKYQVLRLDAPKRRGFHRAYSPKSFLISIAAMVLLAGYFVNWFSDSEGDKGNASAQQAAAIVYKKMPAPAEDKDASLLLKNRSEYPGEAPPKEQADIAEAPRAVGSIEDAIASPEEPDPASAIDYVLKKRGMDR